MRTIIDGTEFEEQLKRFGDIRVLDEALRANMWALSTRPEAYEVIPGSRSLRVIKTLRISREGMSTPSFRIYFSIQSESILLHWIESHEEEE